jgi:NADH:ubiquinone oxidoreductase subunit
LVCWAVHDWTDGAACDYSKISKIYSKRAMSRRIISMDLVTLITLKLTAKEVGIDQFKNRYYEERRARSGKPPRRYVRYNGLSEATKVPADWHGWLHHTELSPPPLDGYKKHEWQKEHQPNLTGTLNAYRPQGHMLNGGKRRSATGDYKPWTPT